MGSKRGIESFLTPSTSTNYEGGLEASLNISYLIAKAGYPHTVGESLLLPVVRELITTVMKMNPEPILQSLPLSNNTVQRRIDEMADTIEQQLISELRVSKFAIQLDESTFGRNSILMIYVRYYSNAKEEIIEEFFCAKPLETYTSGEDIFHCFENIFQQYDIPLSNITAASCDGASAMVGKYRGFLAYLKNKMPNIWTVHCFLHRQHLVAKNIQEELHSVLKLCIKAINTIKALNDRLFAQLCDHNDESYNHLLLHTDVRWLSKGNCLQRFIDIFNRVIEFFLDIDKPMATQLINFKKHVFYLADICSLFNATQNQLQRRDINLIEARTIIFGFRSKIDLFISTLNRKEFRYFDNLMRLSVIEKDYISSDDILLYTSHLLNLKEDFNVRFQDIDNLNVPAWLIEPMHCDISDLDIQIQEELIALKEDVQAQVLFEIHGYAKFWNLKVIREKYPQIKVVTEPALLTFPSSYLVEAGFSQVNNLLRKTRNRLNIFERGDLRIMLSNFKPNIKKIVSLHQAQPSH